MRKNKESLDKRQQHHHNNLALNCETNGIGTFDRESTCKRQQQKYNLILIGANAQEKCSTGNKLLNDAYAFDSGRVRGDKIQIKDGKEFKIAIFPEFGDKNQARSQLCDLLCSDGNHFILVLIVEFYNKDSGRFLDMARNLLNYFGSSALKSLLIACIQSGDIRYSDDDFENNLYQTEGYNFLMDNNNGKDLNYILWDNINPYDEQDENLRNKLSNCDSFNIEMMDIFE